MSLRVYIDASVIGGCLDEEFAEDSQRVFELARAGYLRLLLSDVVVRELEQAPSPVRHLLETLPESSLEQVAITEEVRQLRDAYITAGVIAQRWVDDATHVAAASVTRADAIVSWNFRHIVRLDKIKGYNQVNRSLGFDELTIVSPKEIRYGEPDED
jgi:predicted nucleic acid-binding protein